MEIRETEARKSDIEKSSEVNWLVSNPRCRTILFSVFFVGRLFFFIIILRDLSFNWISAPVHARIPPRSCLWMYTCINENPRRNWIQLRRDATILDALLETFPSVPSWDSINVGFLRHDKIKKIKCTEKVQSRNGMWNGDRKLRILTDCVFVRFALETNKISNFAVIRF